MTPPIKAPSFDRILQYKMSQDCFELLEHCEQKSEGECFAQDGGKAKQAHPVSTFLNSNVISEAFVLISTSTSYNESF